jgi:hypothetical protein
VDFVSFRRRAYFHASRRRVLKRLPPYSRRPTGPVGRAASHGGRRIRMLSCRQPRAARSARCDAQCSFRGTVIGHADLALQEDGCPD